MRRTLLDWAAFVALAAFGAVLVIASGIIPVRASSGHWEITKAILSYTSRRSIETHAFNTPVPDLADAARILKGAGHYDRGCQPCHGAPGEPSSLIAQELTPEPPELSEMVPTWDEEELFYIVKHGIKMAGMPAWPARERDDEVWDMVAFLQTLPDLSTEEYRRLVHGDMEPPTAARGIGPLGSDRADRPGLHRIEGVPEPVVRSCARCHGADGLGRGVGAFPKLAGQRAQYLAESLEAYRVGERHSGIMQPIAHALDEELILALARHYGEPASGTESGGTGPGAVGPPGTGAGTFEPADSPAGAEPAGPPAVPPSMRGADPRPDRDTADLLQRGERIAREGIPVRKVPSCTECHGPGDRPRNPNYPLLEGQYADYLELQLELFRKRSRGGSEYARLMKEVTHYLEPEEARAVAAWYASMPWQERTPGPP